ncbi:MAG TPA: tetratricopeptide repeat protein, partial [Candidatus Polarisedimenticolaceae bacterium]|nr:tetratricopeptide repeat protein [Candidatus Polarisedimenticolaceae bacterium]
MLPFASARRVWLLAAAAGWMLALAGDRPEPRGAAVPLAGAGVYAGLDEAARREDYVESFARATASLERQVRTRGWRDPDTLEALHRVALVTHLAGDQDTAEEVAELALALRERYLGPRDPRTLVSLVLRGMVAKYANDVKLAQRCYTQALTAIGARAELLPLAADVLVARASALRVDSGEPQAVVRLLEQ